MQITLTLPDELVERAQAAGLLTEQLLSEWIEDALRREDALQRFGEIADALVEGGMTQDELEAELDARKHERMQTQRV